MGPGNGSPINFAEAVAEEPIQFSQTKPHFVPDFSCFHNAEVPVYMLDWRNRCHFIFSLGSSLGFEHIHM